jgi:exo-beta-1,3-glucanase (GH17 family)
MASLLDNGGVGRARPTRAHQHRIAELCQITYYGAIALVKRPAQDEIRKDLEAIRSLATSVGIPDNRIGITTYGCDNGLEQIAPIAGETGIAVLLGIFSPRNKDEVTNAAALLKDPRLKHAIAGVVVGNESVTFRRATLDDVEAVIQHLRQVRSDVPYTTTEIVQAYGNNRLFTICDFTSLNAHALFSNVLDAEDGARWAIQQIDAVRDAAPQGHLILVKEVGWPAGPKPFFSNEQQRSYWRTILRSAVARDVNICFFDPGLFIASCVVRKRVLAVV